MKPIIILCLITLCLVSLPARAYTLSVSHLLPSRGDHAFLLVTDLSGLGPSVKIDFYDDMGHLVSSADKLLPPLGKIQFSVEDYIKSAGTIVLESPSDRITGEYWLVRKNKRVSVLPLQPVGERDRDFINCFRIPPCDQIYIVISDPNGSGPMVQMEFYSRAGELIKIVRKLLRPYGMLNFKVSDYVSKDILGKVSVRSFGGSVVLHSRYSCSKGTLFMVPVRVPSKELLVSGFSAGNRAGSILVIMDASAKGPMVKVSLLNVDGEVISSLEESLPPNGAILIDLADYMDASNNGMIRISSQFEIIADYWERDPYTGYWALNIGRSIEEPIPKPQGRVLSISYFALNVQEMLSLLNVSGKPMSAEIQFYDNVGKKLGSKSVLLRPYSRVSESLNHYFGESHLGTVIVREPSAGLVLIGEIFDPKGDQLGRFYAISR